jgi:hypothetical protein
MEMCCKYRNCSLGGNCLLWKFGRLNLIEKPGISRNPFSFPDNPENPDSALRKRVSWLQDLGRNWEWDALGTHPTLGEEKMR